MLVTKNERVIGFRMKEQMLSSSGSIMDNIAEGMERDGKKELIQYLFIAKGSAGELSSQYTRLFDMKVLNEQQHDTLVQEISLLSKRISAFIKYLKTSSPDGIKWKK
ncbi:MAG: four helix bundle protein, partial [Flavobacteriales bacterium]